VRSAFFFSRGPWTPLSFSFTRAEYLFFFTFHRRRRLNRRRFQTNIFILPPEDARTPRRRDFHIHGAFQMHIIIYLYIYICTYKTHRTRLLPGTNNTGRAAVCWYIHYYYTYIYILYSIIPFIYPSSPSSHHRDDCDGNATDDRRSIAE